MIPPLVAALNLQTKGCRPAYRLAKNIVRSLELDHLRRSLGYEGVGSWQAHRDETLSGERPTWLEFCLSEAGITDTTAKNYLECAEAVKQRLRWSTRPGAGKVLKAMEIPPSELSDSEREDLIDSIITFGLTKGDTQTYLRKEFEAAKEPVNSTTEFPSLSEAKKNRVLAVTLEEIKRRKSMEQGRIFAKCYIRHFKNKLSQ